MSEYSFRNQTAFGLGVNFDLRLTRKKRDGFLISTGILYSDFTIDGGEFTPTMKLKRNVAYKKYLNLIETLYTEAKL